MSTRFLIITLAGMLLPALMTMSSNAEAQCCLSPSDMEVDIFTVSHSGSGTRHVTKDDNDYAYCAVIDSAPLVTTNGYYGSCTLTYDSDDDEWNLVAHQSATCKYACVRQPTTCTIGWGNDFWIEGPFNYSRDRSRFAYCAGAGSLRAHFSGATCSSSLTYSSWNFNAGNNSNCYFTCIEDRFACNDLVFDTVDVASHSHPARADASDYPLCAPVDNGHQNGKHCAASYNVWTDRWIMTSDNSESCQFRCIREP